MPKQRPLTASECARLTGITVKALRVYERLGLITPARSAKDYRLYGQKDLVRLNAIATLKSLGLTLAQIRDALEASSPRLSRVLRMQLDEWRARRDAAETAIRLVEAALARTSAREVLSIEELCHLIRSIEMKNEKQAMRTIINEVLTPDEERAWNTYYASLPSDQMAANREHFETSRLITQDLAKLMHDGAAPESAEVQALIERSNALSTKARFREGFLERLEWNAPLARKLHTLGQRVVVTASSPAGSDVVAGGEKFAAFLFAAHKTSKVAQALNAPLAEAKALVARGEKPDSEAARVLARQFAEVCSLLNLGDPLVYAKWCVAYAKVPQGQAWIRMFEESHDSWQFLADASAALEA